MRFEDLREFIIGVFFSGIYRYETHLFLCIQIRQECIDSRRVLENSVHVRTENEPVGTYPPVTHKSFLIAARFRHTHVDLVTINLSYGG